MKDIRTVIVEDDPMVAEINSKYILAQEGYSLVAVLGSGKEVLEFLERNKETADLVILDIYMPELDGIHTLRELRQRGIKLEVIVVSAASDPGTINEAIRAGAFDYITKPFQPERLFQSLKSLSNMQKESLKAPGKFKQEDIDLLFALRSRKQSHSLPKGLSRSTLEKTRSALKTNREGLSANDMALILGTSRVTARRYLEYLVFIGEASLNQYFQDVGRPINRYSPL